MDSKVTKKSSPSSSISSDAEVFKYSSNQANFKQTVSEDIVLRMDSGFESDDSSSLYEDCPEENDFSSAGGRSSVDGHVDPNEKYRTQRVSVTSDRLKAPEPIESVINILQLFFDNKLDEAMEKVCERSDNCIHHSQGKMHFRFFYAMLTLDPVSRLNISTGC